MSCQSCTRRWRRERRGGSPERFKTAPLLLLMGLLRRQSSTECAAAVGALAALALYFRRRRRDITLTYLDAKGSAEATRLALHIGRVPFRDERLSYAEVALLAGQLPFGQVPTLRVGDDSVLPKRGDTEVRRPLRGTVPVRSRIAAALRDGAGVHRRDCTRPAAALV